MFESCLLSLLRRLEASTKSIASYLVVLLHSLQGVRNIKNVNVRSRVCEKIVTSILPLLCASGSQLRILSQLIVHRIFPAGPKADLVAPNVSSELKKTLQPILRYLREQSDMVRMRKKQESLFNHISSKCPWLDCWHTLDTFVIYDEPLLSESKQRIEYHRKLSVCP